MATPRSPSVVIVGYACPLGRCLASEFCLKNAKLMIIEQKECEDLEVSVFKELGAQDVLIHHSSPESFSDWEEIMNIALKQFGKIDFLLYFDTIYYSNEFTTITDVSTIKKIMHTNYTKPLQAINAAIPILQRFNGQIGLIMNIADGQGAAGTTLYLASKRALESYAFAQNKQKENVGFTCIYPGEIIENSLKKERKTKISNFLKGSIMDALLYKEFKCSLATRGRSNTIKQLSGTDIFSNGIPDLEPPPIKKTPIKSSSKLTHLVLEGTKAPFKDFMRTPKPEALDNVIEGDENGRCALHFACFLGHWEFVMSMLKLNKTKLLATKDKYDWTPLHFTAFGGHLRLTKKLLSDSADPNALTSSGMSCLHYLARLDPGEDPKIIARYQLTLKKFLQLGADVNQRNVNWVTPLHEAAVSRASVAVKFFIQNEGDVHRKTRTSKETPLQYAMRPNNRTVISMLLEAGADPIGCFDIAPEKILPKLEEYREKNRRPDPDFEIEQKPPIYVSKIEELPSDALKLFERSGLQDSLDIVYENWDAFLIALRFLSHKRFKNANLRKKKKRRKKKEDSVKGSSGNDEVKESKKEKKESDEEEENDREKEESKKHVPKPAASKMRHEKTLEDISMELISNGNPHKLFRVGEQVGRGGFGSVFCCRRADTKDTVAIKKVSHLTEKEKWNNLDEIYCMEKLKNRYIVPYHSSFLYRDELWMTMEFLSGGSLLEVSKVNRNFEEPHICYVLKQVLKGLSYIHRKGLIHRDLKSANIMIGGHAQVYIIDFGLCTATDNKRGMVGSPFWMPPEMMNLQLNTQAGDLWSLGIIALEMAEGNPPNYRSALASMFNVAIGNVPTLANPSKWSTEFKDFLGRMLVFDHEKRATAAELLKDPWMENAETRQGMQNFFQHLFVEKSLQTLLV